MSQCFSVPSSPFAAAGRCENPRKPFLRSWYWSNLIHAPFSPALPTDQKPLLYLPPKYSYILLYMSIKILSELCRVGTNSSVNFFQKSLKPPLLPPGFDNLTPKLGSGLHNPFLWIRAAEKSTIQYICPEFCGPP